MTPTSDAVIIGAGPAGLACAATMRATGLNVAVLEKADSVGAVWRRHYDRLHLHTDRNHSGSAWHGNAAGLPDLSVARPDGGLSRKLCRSDFNIQANLQCGSCTHSTRRCAMARRNGSGRVHGSRSWSLRPESPVRRIVRHGRAWRTIAGPIIHSSEYRNPAPYAGKRVLVVGFGNSGGEIALDLADAGVDVALAVRSPVQILPRDLLGFPILSWAILYRRLPARLVDIINAPILRLARRQHRKVWGCAARPRGRVRWWTKTGASR